MTESWTAIASIAITNIIADANLLSLDHLHVADSSQVLLMTVSKYHPHWKT